MVTDKLNRDSLNLEAALETALFITSLTLDDPDRFVYKGRSVVTKARFLRELAESLIDPFDATTMLHELTDSGYVTKERYTSREIDGKRRTFKVIGIDHRAVLAAMDRCGCDHASSGDQH